MEYRKVIGPLSFSSLFSNMLNFLNHTMYSNRTFNSLEFLDHFQIFLNEFENNKLGPISFSSLQVSLSTYFLQLVKWIRKQ